MSKKLKTEHQIFIVQALARFDGPSEIIEAVKTEFGLEITRQHVRHYNPEQSDKVAQEWKDLFEKTRAAFLASTVSIGIAHKSYRLQKLHDMAREARRVKNYALAADLIEQAAKECGGHTQHVKVEFVEQKKKQLATILGLESEQLPQPATIH